MFSQKSSQIRWKDILRTNTIWDAFYKKFATFSGSEKIKGFVSKKTYIFPKKPKFWTFWEILLLQSLSAAKLLQFGDKNSRSEMWTSIVYRERNWHTSGKKSTHLNACI